MDDAAPLMGPGRRAVQVADYLTEGEDAHGGTFEQPW